MKSLKKFAHLAGSVSLSVSLAACHTTGTTGTGVATNSARAYCEEKPAVCVLIGALVVGGVVAIASKGGGGGGGDGGGGNGGYGGGGGNAGNASDVRLKTDVQPVGTLENGINLYAFRYVGDDRVFVGVLAQELLADDRYAHAVHATANGMLLVDYDALRLRLVGGGEMRAAGEQAVARLNAL